MPTHPHWSLRCRGCRATREPGSVDYVCRVCGGEFVVEYDEAPPPRPRAGVGMWRWSSRLPVATGESVVSLGEGSTPLVGLTPSLRETLGVASVSVKCEHLNPTGSFKDRIASVAVSLTAERRLRGLVGTSSGNGGAAAAAYAARAGIPLTIFSLADVAPAKLLQIQAFGARVVLVRGVGHDAASTDEVATAVAEHAAAQSAFPFLTGGRFSPEAMEGAATIAYELAEQAPATTVVYCPVGGGGLLSALGRGFAAVGSGVRVVAVQPRGCATIARALDGDLSGLPDDVATQISGLQVPILFDGPGAVDALVGSGGHLVEVDDADVHAAQRRMASQGLLVEPAGATALAGALEDARSGRLAATDHVVLVATGAGWKDTSALTDLAARSSGRGHDMTVIEPDQIGEFLT